jgi:hypothetical protein
MGAAIGLTGSYGLAGFMLWDSGIMLENASSLWIVARSPLFAYDLIL